MAAPTPQLLQFGRAARLKHRRDFVRLRQAGERLATGCLVANWQRLPADSPSRLGVITGRRTGVLQVPRAALNAWDREKAAAAIFVVEGTTARRRAVTTGTVQGDHVEVASGLKAGERVVIRGGFTLKDGDAVRAAAAER